MDIRKVSPTVSAVHVSQPLTNVSLLYANEEDSFVADRAFPVIRVGKQFDQYYEWNKRAFTASEAAKRAPGTRAARMDMNVARHPYACEQWGLAIDVHDQVVANADPQVNPDEMATIALTHQALLNKETEFVKAAMPVDNPGVTWDHSVAGATAATAKFESSRGNFTTTTHTGTNNTVGFWDDEDSKPIEQIRAIKRNILYREANVLVCGKAAYDALLDHADLIGRINRGQTTGAARVMRSTLMELLELDDILVLKAFQDTGKEGLAENVGLISTKQALLLYRPSNSLGSMMIPSAGYTFEWDMYGGGTAGFAVKRYREEDRETGVVEINNSYVQQITAKGMACKFDNVVQYT